MFPQMVYHDDGRSKTVDSERELLGAIKQGWQEEPTHAFLFPGQAPPAGDQTAGTPGPQPPTEDELARVRRVLPPQSALFDMTVGEAKTLVEDNTNPLAVKQVLIDELDNPKYPGGRKTIVDACLERLRSFPPVDHAGGDVDPAAADAAAE